MTSMAAVRLLTGHQNLPCVQRSRKMRLHGGTTAWGSVLVLNHWAPSGQGSSLSCAQ